MFENRLESFDVTVLQLRCQRHVSAAPVAAGVMRRVSEPALFARSLFGQRLVTAEPTISLLLILPNI